MYYERDLHIIERIKVYIYQCFENRIEPVGSIDWIVDQPQNWFGSMQKTICELNRMRTVRTSGRTGEPTDSHRTKLFAPINFYFF